MTTKFAKSTSKGQVTLPKEWRSQFNTDNFLMEMHDQKIVIKPIEIGELVDEEVVFDAKKDNDGKGISLDEMIKLLKKVQNG